MAASTSTSTSTSSLSSTTAANVKSKTTEQHLANLLTNPNTFTISSYLNKALEFESQDLSASSSSSTATATVTATLEDEELQRRMAELALQLQVQTQSCHDEIGRIGAELRAILPRCAGDLGRLNVGLGGMREDAEGLLDEHLKSSLGYVEPDHVNANVSNGNNGNGNGNAGVTNANASNEEKTMEENGQEEEKEEQPQGGDDSNNNNNNNNDENMPPSNNNDNTTTTSKNMTPLETLETLSTLHALQQNLTATKSILHSVSTYDKTITTLPSLLTSSQNLNHAVSALITLEEGARALSGMPGNEKRVEEIANTRSKIVTLLKPELLHALKKMETRLGPLQTCVGMYNSLGKIESLMEEYVRNRPGVIHRLWFEFGKVKNSSTSSNTGRNSSRNRSNELEFYGGGGGGGGNTNTNTNEDDDDDLFGDNSDNENDNKNDETIDSSEFHQVSFGTWLPTWYEAVLLLLSEEKRRALTVFGPELAPEIMAKVRGVYMYTAILLYTICIYVYIRVY